MKKLTDYYILITPNIVDEVIEYFGLLQSKNYLIGKYFLFRYDDKESYYTRPTEPQLRTKLKLSELKRFIENSPTREKYRSVQSSIKGYKTVLLRDKKYIDELNNQLKWANRIARSNEDSYEKEKESKKSFLDANLELSKLYESEYHKNKTLHNELLDAEKEIEKLKTALYDTLKYDMIIEDLEQKIKKEKTKFFKYASIGLLLSLCAFAFLIFIFKR